MTTVPAGSFERKNNESSELLNFCFEYLNIPVNFGDISAYLSSADSRKQIREKLLLIFHGMSDLSAIKLLEGVIFGEINESNVNDTPYNHQVISKVIEELSSAEVTNNMNSSFRENIPSDSFFGGLIKPIFVENESTKKPMCAAIDSSLFVNVMTLALIKLQRISVKSVPGTQLVEVLDGGLNATANVA